MNSSKRRVKQQYYQINIQQSLQVSKIGLDMRFKQSCFSRISRFQSLKKKTSNQHPKMIAQPKKKNFWLERFQQVRQGILKICKFSNVNFLVKWNLQNRPINNLQISIKNLLPIVMTNMHKKLLLTNKLSNLLKSLNRSVQ